MFAECERVPLSVQVETEMMLFGRRGRARVLLNYEHTVQLLQQLFRRESVQILQHTIVGKNLHLIVRKNNGQKPACVWVPTARLKDTRGGRAAMMTVRN